MIAKANFSEGRFKARVRLILSVDMNRYSYRFKWKKSGIPFERGVFIYLLLSEPPYSGYVRQTRQGWVDPSLWVIDYYRANDGLAKIFDEIENRLFKK